MSDFSHLNKENQPKMVDVGSKNVSKRLAIAEAFVKLGADLMSQLDDSNELRAKKGPVFQTAIIAGIQGVKQTPFLIPMCHPLSIDGVNITIKPFNHETIRIEVEVKLQGKTGVEMEALMGANITALTVYDMCKAINPHIEIMKISLVEKTGGKNDFKR
ncbi:cyclic pyranopterin monophosphate synthase MoaC [Flavobacteriaceae bacterium]|nr:cyclic pyranopterin monophosphate synthase MoaC [Flavobacteriaceae bacterium]